MTLYALRMTMMSFRADEADAEAVRAWAQRLGVDRSEVMREALRRHLLALASEVDAVTWSQHPHTEAELALVDAEDWGPAEDWSDWAEAGSADAAR